MRPGDDSAVVEEARPADLGRSAGSLPRDRSEDRGGVLAGVRRGGPAARAGLEADDTVVAIDGVVPRDAIDVSFQTQGQAVVTIDYLRQGCVRTAHVMLDGESDVGLEFEQPTFDGLRQCNNNCEFCFIRGLPKGLRRSLYIRDDDYRYSFLFGTFVTLTNLNEEDWQRMGYQRLSPLRVSVHATDPAVRARLLAHPGAPPIIPQLARLGQFGMKVHVQVVLCPGINDGATLERTVSDLAELHDVVESVAIVPVGISDHLRVREIRAVEPAEARGTVASLVHRHGQFRQSIGRGFVYPSDELFLLAGRVVPSISFYDGFPMLQNGVGLVRAMLTDWRRQRRKLPEAVAEPRRVAWLCGRAALAALEEMALDMNRVENLHVQVRVVENRLFGSSIGVSGLMAGRDAVAALSSMTVNRAVMPRSAFGYDGERTLDEWTVPAIERASGVPIVLGTTAGDLIVATLG